MKSISGEVIATKMAKTVVVAVERTYAHPKYYKRIKRTKKYHAHDEMGVKVGDRVKLTETAPVSKTVQWKVTEVIK